MNEQVSEWLHVWVQGLACRNPPILRIQGAWHHLAHSVAMSCKRTTPTFSWDQELPSEGQNRMPLLPQQITYQWPEEGSSSHQVFFGDNDAVRELLRGVGGGLEAMLAQVNWPG